MPHTVASYIHSDATSKGKGGCLARIETETDFGSNTEEVQEFAKKVARMGYGHTALLDDEHDKLDTGVYRVLWDEMIDEYEFLQEELDELKKKMKEKIEVTAIVCLCEV